MIIRNILLATIAFTFLALLSVQSGNSYSETQKKIILMMGDSISAAYGMSLEEGWVELLNQTLKDNEIEYRIVNASISGETSAGGRRRLNNLLNRYSPDIVIIELGGNDGLRGYPIDQLEANLVSMIQLSLNSSARVLVLPMEIPPNYGSRYTSRFRNAYVKVTQETGAILGPFILKDIALNRSLMQTDGIHPKRSAQPIIREAVLKVLLPLLDQ
ncbi:MAG: arylesterase [Halieaceae bacterium]|nr:arylesterase [Halieaceae bacterium]